MRSIKVLNLTNNHLQEVPDLSMFPDVQTLDLSHNSISVLPADAFQSLPQLLHLDISFNNLVLSKTSVSAETFHGLTRLKTLRCVRCCEVVALSIFWIKFNKQVAINFVNFGLLKFYFAKCRYIYIYMCGKRKCSTI